MLYPIKIEFKDYSSGAWQDWTQYLAEFPSTNQRVESENDGEAGVIVFDSASVTFRYEAGNPVYTAFSADLSGKQRYLFRISFLKSNKTYVQRMEGMADFSTIEWPEKEQDVISFEIVDKLSALGILSAELSRTKLSFEGRVLVQQPETNHIYYDLPVIEPSEHMSVSARTQPGEILPLTSPVIFPGEIVIDPRSFINNTDPVYYVVLTSFIQSGVNFLTVYPKIEPRDEDYLLIDIGAGGNNYLSKELYGIDVNNIVNGALANLKGVETIRALYNQAWPGESFTVVPSGLNFSIPSEYAVRMTDENPLGDNPLGALGTILNSVKPSGDSMSGCYFYINKNGSPVIHAKENLESGTERTLGTTKVIRRRKKYFWNKLVDGAKVSVKSWVTDDSGEYLEGTGYKTLQAAGSTGFIKPKNELSKDILAPVQTPPIDTQELLDSYAALEADNILNFYGKRRSAYEFELKLDDNTIQWELVDHIVIDSVKYFFISLEVNPVDRTVSLEAIETTGHDYDCRQVVIGLSESNAVSGSFSSSNQQSSTVNQQSYTFVLPLYLSGTKAAIKNFAFDPGNIIALRDRSIPQELRIYNSYNDENNNEFLSLGFKNNINAFTIETEKTGSGVIRNLAILGGKVGIGTVTPNYKVDVSENFPGTMSALALTNQYAGFPGSVAIALRLTGSDDASSTGVQFLAGKEQSWIDTGSTRDAYLAISTRVDNLLTEKVRITSSGNVGIGINSPNERLEVNGNIHLSGDDRAIFNRSDKALSFGTNNLERFKIDPSGNITIFDGSIGTEGYQSQLSGWKITNSGDADFRYLFTNELHAKTFIADLEQALAGSQIICKSAAKIATEFTLPSGSNSSRLIVESFAGFETAAVFQNGDLVRLRQFTRTSGSVNVADAWGTVSLDTTYGSSGFDIDSKTQAYIFTRHSSVPGSAAGTIKEGTLALDYGVSGNGFIEASSIDGQWAEKSPYNQIVTWNGTPGNYTIHNRTGKLTGITDNDFGGAGGVLPASFGTYINGSAFIKGNIVVKASSQLSLQNTSIMIGNISGTAYNAIKIAHTGNTATSGIFLYDSNSNELLKFALDGSRHIANWNFTKDCFYKGTSAAGFSLNTSSSPFIAGSNAKGFEIFDVNDPKMFLGLKDSAGDLSKGFDWNISAANEFTIKGSIIDLNGLMITASGGINFTDPGFFGTKSINWNFNGSDVMSLGLGIDLNAITFLGINTYGRTFEFSDAVEIPEITSLGDLVINPSGKNILPRVDYDINLGASNKKFKQLHCSELVVQKLISENVMATIGGRILVGQTNTLLENISNSTTLAAFQYQFTGTLPIICYLEGVDLTPGSMTAKVEFIRIDSYSGAYGGGYRYNITRNLDGTGANSWNKGDAIFNTGNAGSGFIDLYSINSLAGPSQLGPSIVGNIRNSTTYNDWSEAWAIGNLSGLYGQSSGTFGVGLGKYANDNTFLVITPADGIQIVKRASDTNSVIADWAPDGTITIGGASGAHTVIDANSIKLKSGVNERIVLNNDGSGLLANGDISWDAEGAININASIAAEKILAGTITGCTLNACSITADGFLQFYDIHDELKGIIGAGPYTGGHIPFKISALGGNLELSGEDITFNGTSLNNSYTNVDLGPNNPSAALGKDGDIIRNTYNGDIFIKIAGAWWGNLTNRAVGLPPGGVPGQVLKKVSHTDYAATWGTDETGGGGNSFNPDTPPSNPSAYDDEFDGDLSKWTQYNTNSNNLSVSNGKLVIASTGEVSNCVRGIYQARPIDDFSMTAKFTHNNTLHDFWSFRLMLRNSFNNRIIIFGYEGSNGALNARVQQYSDWANWNAQLFNSGISGLSKAYFKIIVSGSTINFFYSTDGLTWILVGGTNIEYIGSFNQIGMYWYEDDMDKTMNGTCEWFRINRIL